MNLRKNLGRVASTIVATALLASVATVPAFAAEPGEVVTGASFSIEKVVKKDAGVYSPATTFTFKIAEATPDTNETRDNMKVEAGDIRVFDDTKDEADTEHEITVQYTADDTDLTKTEVSKSTAAIMLGTTGLTHAGVYKYTITEQPGTYKGVSYDTTSKDLFVYVGYAADDTDQTGPLQVLYTVVVDESNTEYEGGKTNNVVNKYGVEDFDDKLGNLTIEKTVTGAQGDKESDFHFAIEINGQAGEKYAATVYTKGADGNYPTTSTETYTFETGESKTIAMHHGEKIVITGLSADDTYEISEVEADQNGYTTTVTGTNTNDTVNGDAITSGSIATVATDDGDKVDADKTIVYTNKRDASTPTGIVMNVAPYALLVVVAVAGCFVFLRKRNED